nr:hypothetical protein [Clostridioides sp.]
MDVVKVVLKGNQNFWYQPENYTIDSEVCLKKIETSSKEKIRDYFMEKDFIFYNSLNYIDSKSLGEEENKYSLIMFKVPELNLWIDGFKENRITVSFTYNGEDYKYIKITDPTITERYIEHVKESSPRPYVVNDAILVMSLAGEYKNNHYKLVANIIEDSSSIFFGRRLAFNK